MLPVRFLFFWNIIDWEIIGGDVINYHYVFILPFAIFGIFAAIKNKKDVLLFILLMLYFTSFVLLFPGTARYRMPIDGFLIILGCYGIYELITNKNKRSYTAPCIVGYLILTYMMYEYSLQTKYFIKTIVEKIGLW